MSAIKADPSDDFEGALLLVKFGKNREHLAQLVAGVMHCRSAEYYRNCERDGAGDPRESCIIALRPGRGIEDWELRINGQVIRDVTSLTFWDGTMKDQYMHCWTVIRMPASAEELALFVSNMTRLHREFGPHYVAFPATMIPEVFARVQESAPHGAEFGEVRYHDGEGTSSPICKAPEFRYQAEARFLLGECPQDPNAVLEFKVAKGFTDIMTLDQVIKITNQSTGAVAFQLEPDGVQGPSKRNVRAL